MDFNTQAAESVSKGRTKTDTGYTTEEKKAFVERSLTEGRHKIAREAGVNITTLYYWERHLMPNQAKNKKPAPIKKQAEPESQPQQLEIAAANEPVTVRQNKAEKQTAEAEKQLTEAEVENVLLKAQIESLTKELTRFKTAIVSLVNEEQ